MLYLSLVVLVVINLLVSKEPGVSMPAWDEGYMEYASAGIDLGGWMVYLLEL